MHIGETAVTHNEHMIARSGGGAHGADQRIYFIKGLGASGERRERRLQIPAERMAARCRAIPENQVGAFKTGGQDRKSVVEGKSGDLGTGVQTCAPPIWPASGASAACKSQPSAWRPVAAPYPKIRSAPSRLAGNCAFITPSFIVFERGSSTARIRACAPTRARKATMVARMALG